jgi:hypothetical protein
MTVEQQITELGAILRDLNNTVRVLKWYMMIMMAAFLLVLRLIVSERVHSRDP